GRRDIDGEIARDIGKSPYAKQIISNAIRGIFIRPDIDADDSDPSPRGKARMRRVIALIVEAQAIDQSLLARQSEQAWTRIAGLRQRGQRADLDETEAQAQQPVGDFGVLV